MNGSNLFFLPMSKHGYDTLHNMSVCDDKEYCIRTSPFCHETIDEKKEVRGWILDMPMDAPASKIPIVENMFHGISVAQCEMNEKEILSLIQNVDATKKALGEAIENIMQNSQKERPTWNRCKPCGLAGGYPASLMQAFKSKDGQILFEKDSMSVYEAPIIDSEDWRPEISPDGFVGFYHMWTQTRDGNKLILYCVCQSYLSKACHEFCEMLYKVGDICSASCVCLSEEVQWLRNLCSRNRARIIADVCRYMKIRVPTVDDYHAATKNKFNVAILTNETLHHDMYISCDVANEKKVRILNYCAETRKSFNGISCVMAPTEGVWIFQGIQSRSSLNIAGVSDFGKPFGDLVLCTAAPKILQKNIGRNSAYTFVLGEDALSHQLWTQGKPVKNSIFSVVPNTESKSMFLNTEGLDMLVIEAYKKSMEKKIETLEGMGVQDEEDPMKREYYLSFDENVLNEMSKLGWPRTQGIVKLIPLACGTYSHWMRKNVETANVI